MVNNSLSSTSSESEDEIYEVEQVISRRQKLGKWEYLIKWKGYRMQENSWEPEDNLIGCSEEIDKYNGKLKKGIPQTKRQSRKLIGITTPPNSPRTTLQQLQEMDVAKYRIIHQISSPVSPFVKDKRETEFSEYKEAKPQDEEKCAKNKNVADKKGTSGLKIIAAILLFSLLFLALVKPVNFRSSTSYS